MISINKKDLPITLIEAGILFWAFNVFIAQLNPISLYVIIPLSFLYCITHYKIRNTNRYFRLYMFVVLWILATLLTTHYLDVSLKEIKFMMGCVMLCYICCCLAEDYKNFEFLYFMWIVYFCGIITYTFISGMMSNMDINNSRFDDAELNANTIAYATFYFTFALYILGVISKHKKIYRNVFFITIPLSFFIALVTASRQVLIIQIPLIFLLITIRYFKYLNYAKTLVIALLLITPVVYFSSDKISDIYQNSLLAKRSEKKLEKDSRPKLLKDAVKVGMEHPIVGVGPGNYVKFSYNLHFSHCTYTELFANNGLPGVSLWILMLVVFLKKQINYYRLTKDRMFLTFFSFGIIFCIDNFFYVFHNVIFLMPLFLIVGTHSDKYFNLQLYEKNNEN